jgi:hypothetical protein
MNGMGMRKIRLEGGNSVSLVFASDCGGIVTTMVGGGLSTLR